MRKKWAFSLRTICMFFCLFLVSPFDKAGAAEKTVLATTFPIYQIVRNVTQGHAGLKVELMMPSQLGCPHDYVLTTQDLQKLAKADILVINGLGMEEFIGAPVKRANPEIRVIDSSAGIKDTLQYSEEQNHEPDNALRRSKGHSKHRHDHHRAASNPHLYASPRMNARLAMNIATELSKADPKGAAIYFKSAQAYADSLNRLADDMAALGKRLANKRIVQPHGIFDYLARDLGLEIVAVMQPHSQEPSASEMIHLVKLIKAERVGAIFIEPQYSDKVGRTLSRETGIPVAMLDPGATGPENAPLNYYETMMRRNLKTLVETLGTY